MEHINAIDYGWRSGDTTLEGRDLSSGEDQDIRNALDSQALLLLVVDGHAVGGVTSAAIEAIETWAEERAQEKLNELGDVAAGAVNDIDTELIHLRATLDELEGTLAEKLLEELEKGLKDIEDSAQRIRDAS